MRTAGWRPIAVVALLLGALAAPAAAVAAPPCSGAFAGEPWCDRSKSPDERAGALVTRLTLTEKFELMGGDDSTGVSNTIPNPQTGEIHTGTSLGIPRLGIPNLFFSDGPVGPRQGQATPLPSPIGLAATFDPRLAERHGAVVGNEAKLKGNDVVFGPAVNIMRNPRGGRTFEYYGEDPFLTARTAVGWIRGAQGEGVIGNVKHFAVNSQEGPPDQPGGNRFVTNAIIDERTLREIYLPHFEAAVREADVGTVMGSYNAVNGSPATENRHLLLDILKGDWGFDGFVLTDYTAQRSTVNAANNGLELELPQAFFFRPEALAAAVAGRQIGEDVIDEHVRRILRVYFKYGVFDRERYPYNRDDLVDKPAHNAETRAIEESSITLLKNSGDTLPVSSRRVRSIAVIGPSADEYKSGGGSSNINPYSPPVTPCDGIRDRGAAEGIDVTCATGSSAAEAAAAARGKDLAIVVATDNLTEFVDKRCLDLQDSCDGNNDGDQDGRIRAVAEANPSTVVLLETGAPVLTPWTDDVEGVVQAWYPGQEGGTAIARVLFGDVDPGGRLPVSFPQAAGDVPTAGDPAAYPGAGADARYSEGVFQGYRHYDEKGIAPRFAFGHGLSYSSYRYGPLRVEPAADGSPRAVVEVDVTNTGSRTGTEVPQLYLGMPDPKPGVTQPPRWLRGFEKLTLAPGQTRTARFALDPRAFSYWDVEADDWRVARGCYEVIVGRSSRDTQGSAVLEQGGATCAGAVPRRNAPTTVVPTRPVGGGGGASPTTCQATSGFGSVAARGAGRGLRLSSTPRGNGGGPVRIDVFQVSSGRRVLRERRVARFSSRSGTTRWNGRSARGDGYYFARFRNGADVRRVTLRRTGGRFRVVSPGFYRRATCDLLPSFKLERAVFGGTGRRPLRISYRLARAARVTVTVTRGARVVRRFAARRDLSGRTVRRIVPLRGLRRGTYRVKLSAVTQAGERISSTLAARRL